MRRSRVVQIGEQCFSAIENKKNSTLFSFVHTDNMEEHCGTEINMILDSVYQLKLQLDDVYVFDKTITSPNTASCQTIVESWYTWPHLMFYFENLDLDCSLGYLQFFQSKDNETRLQGILIWYLYDKTQSLYTTF